MLLEPYFWILVLVGAILSRALSNEAVEARATVFSVASAVFLGLHSGVAILAWIVGLTIWITIACRILINKKEGKASFYFVLGLFSPILVIWIVGKSGDGIGLDPYRWIAFAGLSFFLIRAWTLLKDTGDGRLKDRVLSFPEIASYLLFFPSFLMGPMSYYHEHAASLRKAERLNGDAIVEILFRISVGLTKIYVIAPFFSPFSLQAIQATHTLPLLPTLLAAMSYSVVIWADFSGFSDVAIGCGKLMGIRVPENFNSPYLAPNIREFWQRWHISFSRVLTSYLFIPISRSLSKPLKSHPKVVMVLGYVLTFTFCGFWHGPSLNFIYWGLYHALGLIVYDLFKSRALKKGALQSGAKTTGFLKLLNSAFSTLLTFIFVSVGWILFMIKF